LYDRRFAGSTLNLSLGFLRSLDLKNVSFISYLQRDTELFDMVEVYHENSKIKFHKLNELTSSVSIFKEPELRFATANIAPDYPFTPEISLNSAFQIPKRFDKILLSRKSIGHFKDAPLSLQEVSKLLYSANGIREKIGINIEYENKNIKTELRFRMSPSAGALYPIEIYLISLSVKGLDAGIYYYAVSHHSLRRLHLSKSLRSKLTDIFYIDQQIIHLDHVPLILVLASTFWRTRAKYGLLGYRYSLIEAGHIAQNILLTATALGLASIPVEGYNEDELNRMIGLDGTEESAVYTVFVGKSET